ncbi:uncharacterized protein LOC143020942 isoform X2 [Oratosquilla oratoria]|uniref:uncharacterized protein LOC143020942 isoform X2 n=1 Tax=Oratosquilla oratoria TaxID=337810 RepID=UPI003F75834D
MMSSSLSTKTTTTTSASGWLLTVLSLLFFITGRASGQCYNSPLYLWRGNSTGRIAFPEPNYDQNTGLWHRYQYYPTRVKCSWVIRAPMDHVVTARFLHFDTEESYDYVVLYSSEERNEELVRLSGDLFDWPITSPSSTLVVDFLSDADTTYYGFLLAFHYIPKACTEAGMLVTRNQLIALPPENLQQVQTVPESAKGVPPRSPQFPMSSPPPSMATWLPLSSYPSFVNCTWRVGLEADQMILMSVERFDTNPNDVFLIQKIHEMKAETVIRYGGSDITQTSFYSSKPLLISFASLDSEPGTGFLLNVTYISRGCGSDPKEFKSPKGLLAFPSYNLEPSGVWKSPAPAKYGPEDCQWYVKAPDGYLIELFIEEFDTRPMDKLKIEDNGKLIFTHGGSKPRKKSFRSRSNSLSLSFTSDSDTDRTGFLIRYSWVLQECDGELNKTGGIVSSPYYPSAYGANVSCVWTLRHSPLHVATVLLHRLRIDGGDTLTLSDGETTVELTKSSRLQRRLMEFRPSLGVTFTFTSDSERNKGYFLMQYATYREGSCDFVLSSCGWHPSDPLQAWALHESNKKMQVSENEGTTLQLPRGYRAILASPYITPAKVVFSKNGSTSISSIFSTPFSSVISHPMCLLLEYKILGPDAHDLTVILRDDEVPSERGAPPLEPKELLSIHGPQGELVLKEAVNFTAKGPFQLEIVYERGYGPHYSVAIHSVEIVDSYCDQVDVQKVLSFACDFDTSFCGWRNTHTDHFNWMVTKEGGIVATMGLGGVATVTVPAANKGRGPITPPPPPPPPPSPLSSFKGSSKNNRHSPRSQQMADLVSPRLLKEALSSKSNDPHLCLTFHYRLMDDTSQLHLLLMMEDEDEEPSEQEDRKGKKGKGKPLKKAKAKNHGSAGLHSGKLGTLGKKYRTLWSQGNVQSETWMESQVTVRMKELPDIFRPYFRTQETKLSRLMLVLRAYGMSGVRSSTTSAGVAVRNIGLSQEACQTGPSCSFDSGFCSWQVTSTGRTVWYLRSTEDGGNLAVLVGGGPGDSTGLISEPVMPQTPTSLAFRYRMLYTSQCLEIQLQHVSSSGDRKLLWEQCRGKGDSWLTECIDLPIADEPYQVVFFTGTGEISTNLWLDDVVVTSAPCNTIASHTPSLLHVTPTNKPPQWSCTPSESLCGMTQPPLGIRDWVYVDAPKEAATEPEVVSDLGEVAQGAFLRDARPGQDEPTKNNKTQKSDGFFDGGKSEVACDNGTPLEVAWVCDGIPDCEDFSDEKDCACPISTKENLNTGCLQETEPAHSVHLVQGHCLDGSFMCPTGQGCPPHICPDSWLCLPRNLVCDGVVHCHGGEDEVACDGVTRNYHNQVRHELLECSGGLKVPTSWRCDGRKDCPLDGLDEVGCAPCNPGEFLCATAGVCVRQIEVCDNFPTLPSCSDELFCNVCPPAHFVCDVCVASWQICDGVWDCAEGEDERNCFASPFSPTAECQPGQYLCSSGECLPTQAECDRRVDCSDGDDEKHCMDDNFLVEKYISVKPSPHGLNGPLARAASRLLTPPLSHPHTHVGILTFKYRLDSWLGDSNATLSVETVSEVDLGYGIQRWAAWRQSGHRGRHWLNAAVLLPYMGHDRYKAVFLVSDDNHFHQSQQIHLADLKFALHSPDDLAMFEEYLNCEFRATLCIWAQSSTSGGRFSWVYTPTSTHARRTGPITGHYVPGRSPSGFLYADSLHGSEGHVADLVSWPLLLLPQHNFSLCFKLWVFLYGADVAKVSIHAAQQDPRLSNQYHSQRPISSSFHHNSELYHIGGNQGLGWIPVQVQVTNASLADPLMPFVLVVRATRGPGPEGDIALDDLQLLGGTCSEGSPDVSLLAGILQNPSSLLLTFGPPHTTPGDYDPSEAPQAAPRGTECAQLSSCSECVSSEEVLCSWCDLTSSCSLSSHTSATSCPSHHLIRHANSSGIRQSPASCPQLLPHQVKEILVPSGTAPHLSFGVQNLQAQQSRPEESGWRCQIHTTKDPETKEDFKLPAVFQGWVYDIGMGQDNGIGMGSIRCDNEDGQMILSIPTSSTSTTTTPTTTSSSTSSSSSSSSSSIPYSSATHEVQVSLITPAGAILDNPAGVHVLVYECGAMASDCHGCSAINETYSCGWCQATQSCTVRQKCEGTWRMDPEGCKKPPPPKKTPTPLSKKNGATTKGQKPLKGVSMLEEEGEKLAKGGVKKQDEEIEKRIGKGVKQEDEEEKEELAEEEEEETVSGEKEEESKKKKKREEEFLQEFLETSFPESKKDLLNITEGLDTLEGPPGGDKLVDNDVWFGKKKKSKLDAGDETSENDDEDDDEDDSDIDGDDEVTFLKKQRQAISDDEEKVKSSKKRVKDSHRRSGRRGDKSEKGTSIKVVGRKGRAFLRIPRNTGIFVARDTWRLHTGRRYYVPITRKLLINLGFVRQVMYGSLTEEQSRTVLLNGKWKKAAGYFLDMYERDTEEPVTSIITTSRTIFEQLMAQLDDRIKD